MSMPPFPSVCSVYGPYNAPALVQADVPCRLVPVTRVFPQAASPASFNSITHWVDVPKGTSMIGGYRQNTALAVTTTYQFDVSIAHFIVVCSAPHPYRIFVVHFVEERYLDTADWHRRAWLHWVQSVPGFTDPC